jgi:feruloyl-CoA synthase
VNLQLGAAGDKPPFRRTNFVEPLVDVERRADGTLILRSPRALGQIERNLIAYLRRWSGTTPDQPMLAERGPDKSWRKVTYAEMRRMADATGQALLDRGLGPDKPLMILSGNSIEHAALTLGAMTVGVPVAPVSVAYSLMSRDHGKLKYVFDLVRPAAIFVQQGRMFEAALKALDLRGVELIVVDAPPATLPASQYAELLGTKPGAAVERAYSAVGPDTVAKILFTSGSTGMPKGVPNTQRMLCANQRMSEVVQGPDLEQPPIVLDWLPWNHTMGGNASFNGVMRLGGTLYIDGGRPLPGMFEQTIANLREVSPTYFANVPSGFAVLADHLENDDALRQSFFKNLKTLAYGGASLPQELWQRYQDIAVRATGERIPFVTGWGATETAPVVTTLHWAVEGSGIIGLPLPGVELKMVPSGDKYELRVRGPIVTPGYHRRPDLTAAAFDEEGFYKIGDAGRFVDAADPKQGLRFAGRVAEDFKLATGTWVAAGTLRLAALDAAAPLLQDAVIAGHDREYIALLAWPNVAGCRELFAGTPVPTDTAGLLTSPQVVDRIRSGFRTHNGHFPGSSTCVVRVLLMSEPPSIDGNEITDKGYVNQRATLDRRATLVEKLYADPPADDVIIV